MPRNSARLAILAVVGSLLAGCTSAIGECRKNYPAGSAAYEACFQAVLQQQNQAQNRRDIQELRARRD